MPTITFSLNDLQNLLKRKVSLEQLKELIEYAKGNFEDYDEEEDEVKVDLDDTNLPYLWSIEGFVRLIKGILGKEKGIPKLKINNSNYSVIVDRSVKKIRPYIAAFVAKECKVDDYLIKQMVQLQEKLSETYGRKRKKIAIGVYSHKKIKYPIYYKATDPDSVKFIPLESRKEMTQKQILEEHPKGQEYAWILKDLKKCPILIDDKNDVLSFPPIINSNETGKIEEGDDELFFEATGENLEDVLLVTNIFAYALQDRGFKIFSVNIKYHDKNILTPHLFNEKIKVDKDKIQKILGLDLKESEIKRLLERMRYDYVKGKVVIPSYRKDILHQVDVIEDIGISYGYNKIKPLSLTTYSIGTTFPIVNFVDKVREIIIGLGYQEIMSPVLTNKEILYEKMNIKDFGTVEIDQYMSETYSVIRSWILPILMDFLSKNRHTEYPQKVFEQGLVTVRKGEEIKDYERIAIVSAHEKTDFTVMKQVLDTLFRNLGVSYEIEETEHESFIEGRVGRVSVNGKNVAYIGEINPAVLNNIGLSVPVSGLELNLSDLFESIKEK